MEVNLTFSQRQRKAFNLLKEETTRCLLYGGAKGGGKSVLGCYWSFLGAIDIINKFNLPPSKYPLPVGFMGRKRSVDFTDTTLETWKKFIPESAYYIRASEKEIIINDRVKIAYGGFDSEMDIKKFNSAEFGFGFIDQAEETTQDDIGLLRGALRLKVVGQELDYKLLLTANPADCWLKDSYIDSPAKGHLFLRALPTDNPFLPKGYIDTLLDAFKHRPELIEAYVHGNWDVLSGANLVIKPEWIQGAIRRPLHNWLGRVIVSCDPARYGDDETVIYVLRDGQIIDNLIYGQKSTMETAGHCIALKNRHNAELIVVDSVGVGGGVVDRLMELDQPVKDVNFASRPAEEKRDKYYNLRSEVYWEASEMFSNQLVSIPNDTSIRQQLGHIGYTTASRGRIKIESKADIKKRLSGKSPDRADALVMGLWGLQFIPEKHNDYNRIDRRESALAGGQYSRISPLYLEMIDQMNDGQYPRSDYDL